MALTFVFYATAALARLGPNPGAPRLSLRGPRGAEGAGAPGSVRRVSPTDPRCNASRFTARMACTKCGSIGADVRPDWSPAPQPLMPSGSRHSIDKIRAFACAAHQLAPVMNASLGRRHSKLSRPPAGAPPITRPGFLFQQSPSPSDPAFAGNGQSPRPRKRPRPAARPSQGDILCNETIIPRIAAKPRPQGYGSKPPTRPRCHAAVSVYARIATLNSSRLSAKTI
jgi:hypothetical protein